MVDDLGALGAAVAGLAPGSLDCYVQLPVQVAPRGNAVIDRVRNFLENGLLARFTAASTILPALSDDGRVILVGATLRAKRRHPMTRARDWRCWTSLPMPSRLTSRRPGSGSGGSPNTEAAEKIASAALGGEPTREEALADLQAREPKMSFDDLRVEVIWLVNGQF